MSPHSPKPALRMRTVRSVSELRSQLAPARREGLTIGLVPTMGALHDGHLSLMRRARERCDVVVVSLFVNPAQFDERSDLERYPRDERRDGELAERAGADVLFAPPVAEVYPPGFATTVEVRRRERAPRGRGTRRRALPRRRHGRDQAAVHGAARRRLLRPEGRPAAGADPPPRARPEPAGADRGAADGARARRPGDVQPQRAAVAPTSAPARSRCRRRSQRARALAAGGERSRAAPARRRRAPRWRRSTSSPSTSRSSTPTRSSPSARSPARRCSRVAARVGAVRLIDNALLTPASSPTQAPSQRLRGEAIATCSA